MCTVHGQLSKMWIWYPPRFGDLVTLVDVDQSQPGFALVSSGPGQPKSTRNYHGQFWSDHNDILEIMTGPNLLSAYRHVCGDLTYPSIMISWRY